MNTVVFSTPSYAYFASGLAVHLNAPYCNTEHTRFPNGEFNFTCKGDYRGVNAVLVAGTNSDGEIVSTMLLANILRQMGVASIDVVVPYLGYSTSERPDPIKGEFANSPAITNMLSCLPHGYARGNRIFLLDLHVGIVQFYFNGVSALHITSEKVFDPIIETLFSETNIPRVIGGADGGRVKQLAEIAERFGANTAHVDKKRVSGSKTVSLGIRGEVAGAHVVMYDDMIRTMGSAKNASIEFYEAGALRVDFVAPHFDFCASAQPVTSMLLGNIITDAGFENVVVSNSLPTFQVISDKRLRVVDVAGLFVPYLLS